MVRPEQGELSDSQQQLSAQSPFLLATVGQGNSPRKRESRIALAAGTSKEKTRDKFFWENVGS